MACVSQPASLPRRTRIGYGLGSVATGSFAIPANDPAPVLGTEAQAGPNCAVIGADIDGVIAGELIGMLDEDAIGAELIGAAAGLLQVQGRRIVVPDTQRLRQATNSR